MGLAYCFGSVDAGESILHESLKCEAGRPDPVANIELRREHYGLKPHASIDGLWVSTITPDVHAVTIPYLKRMAKAMLGDEYINSVRAEVARRKKRSASSAGPLSENSPAKRITEGSC